MFIHCNRAQCVGIKVALRELMEASLQKPGNATDMKCLKRLGIMVG